MENEFRAAAYLAGAMGWYTLENKIKQENYGISDPSYEDKALSEKDISKLAEEENK